MEDIVVRMPDEISDQLLRRYGRCPNSVTPGREHEYHLGVMARELAWSRTTIEQLRRDLAASEARVRAVRPCD